MIEISEKDYCLLQEYKVMKKLDEYALEFWHNLVEESFHHELRLVRLPIRFQACSLEEYRRENQGNACPKRIESTGKEITVVLVKFCVDNEIEEAYQVIRHELLHFSLGLLNLEQDDYAAVFKILCEHYDGFFYRSLNKYQSYIYEKGKIIVEELYDYIDKLDDIVAKNTLCDVLKLLGKTQMDSFEEIDGILEKVDDKMIELRDYVKILYWKQYKKYWENDK